MDPRMCNVITFNILLKTINQRTYPPLNTEHNSLKCLLQSSKENIFVISYFFIFNKVHN